jgi:hypothetical protein
MKQVELWKEKIKALDVVNTKNKNGRVMRTAMSELRKEGVIFVPLGKFNYFKVDETMTDDVERFLKKQIKHLKTQYFNTVKPLRNYVSDEKLKSMMGQLSFLDQL